MSEVPAASAASTPGARLGKAREGRGWSAAQAAELMRLPVGVVESLEADRYSDLGAPVFARGHLRRYATLLELPVEPLLEAYDRSHTGPAPRA
jgi:cytoskeleton protein RodZ